MPPYAPQVSLLLVCETVSGIKKRLKNKVKRGWWNLLVVQLKFSSSLTTTASLGIRNHHLPQIPGKQEAFYIMFFTQGIPGIMWETTEMSHRMTRIFCIILNVLVSFNKIWKIFNCNYKLHFEKVLLFNAAFTRIKSCQSQARRVSLETFLFEAFIEAFIGCWCSIFYSVVQRKKKKDEN